MIFRETYRSQDARLQTPIPCYPMHTHHHFSRALTRVLPTCGDVSAFPEARLRHLRKSNFWAPSLLPQEPAGLYRRQIRQAAKELERSEVAGRCHADRSPHNNRAANVSATMVNRSPHRDSRRPQLHCLQRPRPLAVSSTGTWGIL